MQSVETGQSVNIRPGVSILSVLRHLNYKPWFALAEFVDNSLQSFLDHRAELEIIEGQGFKLQVSLELDPTDNGRITIRDNAAGIHEAHYPRAFRPAEIPVNRTGLSEFGMGMKSAACWFAPNWMVRTSALGEPIERTVNFDIATIVSDDIEELQVITRPAPSNTHYTEIVLSNLHKTPQGTTIGKIKDHLASIYRMFIGDGTLELRFDGRALSCEKPKILCAPFYKDEAGEAKEWRKEITFDFGLGLRAYGFAALRETASVSGAGFALFRRGRLIQGSADEGYRPEFIFGKSNSYPYQRLFGELTLEGFEVSHTKDGFRWEENEETFLELLKEHLDAAPLPLIKQAQEHRVRLKPKELKPGAEAAAQRTAETIKREVPSVLQHQLEATPETQGLPAVLPPTTMAARRVIDVELNGQQWRIELELSDDPAIGEWVSIYDQEASQGTALDDTARRVGVRVALAHPFMERFGGTDASYIEPLLRVAAAIALAEVAARSSGIRQAGTIRRNINELLRDALSKP
jgi:hypothetical protein